MAKGYLARHKVSFTVDSVENLNEPAIQEQNSHLTAEQVTEVLEVLTQVTAVEDEAFEESPAEED